MSIATTRSCEFAHLRCFAHLHCVALGLVLLGRRETAGVRGEVVAAGHHYDGGLRGRGAHYQTTRAGLVALNQRRLDRIVLVMDLSRFESSAASNSRQ